MLSLLATARADTTAAPCRSKAMALAVRQVATRTSVRPMVDVVPEVRLTKTENVAVESVVRDPVKLALRSTNVLPVAASQTVYVAPLVKPDSKRSTVVPLDRLVKVVNVFAPLVPRKTATSATRSASMVRTGATPSVVLKDLPKTPRRNNVSVTRLRRSSSGLATMPNVSTDVPARPLLGTLPSVVPMERPRMETPVPVNVPRLNKS